MAFKQQQLIKKIADNISFSSCVTLLENTIGLFDDDRSAQLFYSGIFKIVFGYKNLEELDTLNKTTNYPAIDIGDEKEGIAFQITVQKDSQKIKDTIELFLKKELYKKYSRLVIYVIGKKQEKYSFKFDTKEKFNFNPSQDIWDDKFLIQEINKLGLNELQTLDDYLHQTLDEIKDIDRLFDEDIKKCLSIFKKNLSPLLSSEAKMANIPIRGDKYIETKNLINNISWEFFKKNIRCHILYNEQITNFLTNPINQKILKDYCDITKTIHQFYLDNEKRLVTFENVFIEIFTKINFYSDGCSQNNFSKKMRIIIHNMYFNCDIGKNPKQL